MGGERTKSIMSAPDYRIKVSHNNVITVVDIE